MRYLGIDYGSKRIGLATSDTSGTIAQPLTVIPNTKKLVSEILTILEEEGIGTVILGESKDFKGKDNTIMEKIRGFKKLLEHETQKPVIFEPEFLTSHQATHFQGKHALLDASAAALILQSYLDKMKNQKP